MVSKHILTALKKIYKKQLLINQPLQNYTTFKIGGPATVMVFPSSLEEMVRTILLLKKTPYVILGSGSNVLASDQGFDGVVVNTTKLTGIEEEDNKLLVWAGTPLNQVISYANNRGLRGMQEGFGIPGTVGGAVRGNAGAYGYETGNCVCGVLALIDEKMTYLSHEEMQFSYRNSFIKTLPNAIILRVDFSLTPNASIKDLQTISQDILEKRRTNQPLNYPSAGSVFKRIEGNPVSKLIDQAGLKGYQVGDACVSEKHAGFIVNLGHATCSDVLAVIQQVKNSIQAMYHLDLEEEIKLI